MRLRPALLLTGALLLLSSLYLPWEEGSCNVGGVNFAQCETVDAWSSSAGDAEALFALLLAVVAATALARPSAARDRLLDLGGLFAGYFGLAIGAETHAFGHFEASVVHVHYTTGSYLGVAGTIVVLVTAGATRRWELGRIAGARLATLLLAVGLLVALLLPWALLFFGTRVTLLGGVTPAGVVTAVIALCLVVGQGNRLGVAAAAALFTGAAFGTMTFYEQRAYGAWTGLGLALALVALALPGAGISKPARPPAFALAAGAAATLLIVSLFLPWQRECIPAGVSFGPSGGRCFSVDGWTSTAGSAAAVLALALAFFLLVPRRHGAPVVELAAGVGLLIATLGFQLVESPLGGGRFDFGYGSGLGFAAAALLVLLVLVRVRPPRFDRNDVARLLPIAACAGYAVIVVLPWWAVLSHHAQTVLRFTPLSWLTVVGVLVDIRLIGLWARRVTDVRLVLLPLALLALAALELIRFREAGIEWGGGIVLGICLLLAFLGRVEQDGGLRNLHVPEILRVDRL
jgi:hypothetical protein